MIRIYSENDVNTAKEKKRKMALTAILLGVACLAVNAVIVVLKFNVPWGQSTFWYLFANCTVSIVYGAWLIYFFGLPYKLTKQYCALYSASFYARVTPERAIFLGMREELEDRDGILFYELLFYPGVDQKGNERVLKVYLEEERPNPDLEIGDEALVESQSGILVGYEVTKRSAVSDEELDAIRQRINKKLGIITADIEE